MTYLRLSSTRGGAGGIERQREDCVDLARTIGLDTVAEFVDEGRSAYRGPERAGFSELLNVARTAEWVAVVVWHLDRLTRRSTHLEELIELAATRRVPIYAVHGGLLDLGTHEGRMVARFMT